MLKTVLLTVILISVVGGMITLFSKLTEKGNIQKVTPTVKDKTQISLPGSLTQTDTGSKELPKELVTEPSLSKDEFIRILEASVSALNEKISSTNKKIDDLSKQVSAQPVSSTAITTSTTTTSSGPKTLYIPIGYGGSGTSSSDFGTIIGQEVTINVFDYPGYRQMVFEANFRIFQGNGEAQVRLFNKTDGTAVSGSGISSTSQDYSTKTSGGFTLPGGSKTYTVQTKSTTGYSVDLQLTRIRIDF